MTPEPFSHMPIEELLRRAHDGDQEAWELLISRYRDTLRDWARQKMSPGTPGGVLPSDVAQVAAMKAWMSFQRLPQLEGKSQGELEKWLRKVVGSSLSDLVRKAEAEKRDDSGMLSLDSSEAINVPASQPSPSQFSAQRETFREFVRHFHELPDDQREVVYLQHCQRRPMSELTERLGRSEQAVDSLLRRAVDTLRDRMKCSSDASSSPRMDAALSRYFWLRRTDSPFDLEVLLSEYPDCAPGLGHLLGWLEKLRDLLPPDEEE